MTWKFDGRPKNTIGQLLYTMSSVEHHFKAIGEFKLELQSGNAQFGSKLVIFFAPCDIKIWQMTLKNNRAHLLSYFKLCASFHNHLSIQNGVTVRKRQIWVKVSDFFLSRVTLKFDRWPWKTIGHLFYAPSSFVYHFIAFCVSKWSYSRETPNLGQNRRFFLSRVTLKFDRWPWKSIGHLFYATSSLVHHFIAICEFKMELESGNAQFGSKSAIFCLVWPWNLTDDLEKQ